MKYWKMQWFFIGFYIGCPYVCGCFFNTCFLACLPPNNFLTVFPHYQKISQLKRISGPKYVLIHSKTKTFNGIRVPRGLEKLRETCRKNSANPETLTPPWCRVMAQKPDKIITNATSPRYLLILYTQ